MSAALEVAPVDPPVVEGDETEEQLGAQLDSETEQLLRDLQEQQLAVQRMLQQQREQSEELGDVKDRMAAELLELQDEAWRLQVYSELEMLKRQLAAINALDSDLANMEAQLDTYDETAAVGDAADAAAADGANLPTDGNAGALSAAEGIDMAEADDELAGVDEMQQQLDEELAAMYKQLESVKAEAAAVSARKAALEAELLSLLAGQLELDDGAEEDSLAGGGVHEAEAGAQVEEEGEEELLSTPAADLAVAPDQARGELQAASPAKGGVEHRAQPVAVEE